MTPDDSGPFIADGRGVSEVVGMTLLLGIVVLGMAVILMVGLTTMSEDQAAVEAGQAEQGLTQFDDAAARVATGGTTAQEVDLGLRHNRGTLDVEDDAGHITVRYVDFFEPENTTEVMNTSLGAVRYESGGTSVAYQGGGVWRHDGDGSVMISPPEIATRGDTLSMPVVKTTRGGSVHSDVQVVRAGSEQRFPDPASNATNKLEDVQIEITIESRYYLAWGRFFEDETDAAIVQYDHTEERTTVMFLGGLPTMISSDAGVIATSGPGELDLAASSAYVDSYDSSVKSYDAHAVDERNDGVVKAAGDVDMAGGSEILGDTHSGKTIIMRGGSYIDGDAYAHEEIDKRSNEAEVNGTEHTGTDTIPHIPPINRVIDDNLTRLQDPANNSNDETDVIDGNAEIDIDGDVGTLYAGEYYLENLELDTETLVLDTSDGDITIGVRDWVGLLAQGQAGSHIRLEGDGNVSFFMGSEEAFDVSGMGQGRTELDEAHLYVEDNSSIDVPGDRSERMRVYGKEHFQGAVGGSSSGKNPDVTAAVIAPAGVEGEGRVLVHKADVFGMIITGNLTANENGSIHFDRALMDAEIVPLAPNVPRIEYLYLTENDIRVESA